MLDELRLRYPDGTLKTINLSVFGPVLLPVQTVYRYVGSSNDNLTGAAEIAHEQPIGCSEALLLRFMWSLPAAAPSLRLSSLV
ncbi:hypothetical protein OG884_08280 [Streptosporangium sp. NBC_01755]|uniref:hypothetical protein n=1 Tax=unclassified Streptosporangium TaxID=2632669 RepID=UPI002DDB8C41|nr:MULTISPECIES: hypothetical protein [unclassified Streptosporangium]WSA26674.1 hypothetical protein OIE13_01880 [Streptosporangium sp. NBC_01810]WSD01902.1 hypothetical protein OG884_08280 [Streptosporangium sp. NBC_01755]